MISPKLVLTLTTAIPVLVVVFAVLMGGYLVADGLQAQLETRLLRGLAIASVLLLLADVILLLPVLAISFLENQQKEERAAERSTQQDSVDNSAGDLD